MVGPQAATICRSGRPVATQIQADRDPTRQPPAVIKPPQSLTARNSTRAKDKELIERHGV